MKTAHTVVSKEYKCWPRTNQIYGKVFNSFYVLITFSSMPQTHDPLGLAWSIQYEDLFCSFSKHANLLDLLRVTQKCQQTC